MYVNHGRKDCPSDSKTIYSGMLAGAGAASGGGGAELLCLVPDPAYGNGSVADAGSSDLYMAEYVPGSTKFSAYQAVASFSVPCTVCQAPDAREYAMVNVGRQSCEPGFQLDFKGFIMVRCQLRRKS
jgi:hypothetical protein